MCAYTKKEQAAHPGDNIKEYSGKTAAQCKALCDAEAKCQTVAFATNRVCKPTKKGQCVKTAGYCGLKGGSKSTISHDTNYEKGDYMNLDAYIKGALIKPEIVGTIASDGSTEDKKA